MSEAEAIPTEIEGFGEIEDVEIEWNLSGEPFLTPEGALVDAAVHGVERALGRKPVLSTSGGTSDGRFIATLGTQVVELGPVNATIHKIDERVMASDLDRLSSAYEHILEYLFVPATQETTA